MEFLQHLGGTLKKVLHIGLEVAANVEPIVALPFSEGIPLYQPTLGLATDAEDVETRESNLGLLQRTRE
jgi:hypothetical protein